MQDEYSTRRSIKVMHSLCSCGADLVRWHFKISSELPLKRCSQIAQYSFSRAALKSPHRVPFLAIDLWPQPQTKHTAVFVSESITPGAKSLFRLRVQLSFQAFNAFILFLRYPHIRGSSSIIIRVMSFNTNK